MTNQEISNKLFKHRFALFVILLVLPGLYLVTNLITYWPDILSRIVETQRYFHKLLSTHIKAVANNTDTYGWSLLGISFAYGLFHAAGPGHGKAIIITYLASQKESIKQGVVISFLASLFQSLIAIGLIVILVLMLNLKFRDVTQTGQQVEQIGYMLIVLLGGFLALRALLSLARFRRKRDESVHEHEHDEHCNHSYVPDQKLRLTKTIGVAFSMGMRPCSGAILVLIYAQVINVFWYGVLATLAIGLGTGLALALLAALSVYARNWTQELFQSNSEHRHGSIMSEVLALVGGLLLVFLGWSLYSVAVQVSQNHPLL